MNIQQTSLELGISVHQILLRMCKVIQRIEISVQSTFLV
jgi:hypothetical protein